MKIKTGCDIVDIKRFSRLNKVALKKIFLRSELRNKTESLAGIFAAKESCRKVFNDLGWHDIEIKKEKTGKPKLMLHKHNKDMLSYDLSISHDKGCAIAIAVFLMK